MIFSIYLCILCRIIHLLEVNAYKWSFNNLISIEFRQFEENVAIETLAIADFQLMPGYKVLEFVSVDNLAKINSG